MKSLLDPLAISGIFDLRANRLDSVPPGIEELTRLEKFDLRWNKVSFFPEWIQRLEERGWLFSNKTAQGMRPCETS